MIEVDIKSKPKVDIYLSKEKGVFINLVGKYISGGGGGGTGGGGDVPQIIKLKDTISPSDSNIYSALRSRDEFAKRKESESFLENVSFNKEIELHQGFKTPNFNDSAGQFTGAQLTQAGLLSVAGLRAGYFEVFELIYNKIRAQGGKVVLSPAGVVEFCSYRLTDNRGIVTPDEFYADESPYTLNDIEWVNITFKKEEFNNGLLLFEQGDILYGYVNQIGESGQYARGGQSCMYVVSSDDEIAESNKTKSMTLRAVLFLSEITDENGNPYDSSNVVAGNMAPTIGMSLAQRGNVGADKQERMTSFFIDSMTGNIIMLQNVMTPTIQSGHYGAILGRLPSDMYDKLHEYFAQLKSYDPALYVKNAFIENLVRVTHDGVPIPTEVYRGAWKKSIAEGAVTGEDIYRANASEYHTVTHDGSLWKCNVEGTTVEPSPNIAEWMLMIAKGDSTLSTYTIKPSVNVVYFTQSGDDIKPSVDKIEVSVGETSSVGYSEITEQSELTERGLSIWYNIDGVGEVKELNISPSAMFMLEDGSAIIATEDGSGLSLEGDELNLADIKDNITIYLKRGDDILSIAVIPVMKAGSFKSTVFSRDVSVKDTTPEGGSYYNPIPDGGKWSDGIPEGSGIIYSSSCTFYGDGTSSGWTKAKAMVDTADFEVLYSPVAFAGETEARKAIHKGFKKDGVDIDKTWLEEANNKGWFDETIDSNGKTFSALWMATNHRQSGSDWSDEGWVVTKVKGEKGDPGEASYIADLDNEVDSIGLKASGIPDKEYTVSTNVYMYFGQDNLAPSVTAKIAEGLTAGWSEPSVEGNKVSLTTTGKAVSSRTVVEITLKAVHNDTEITRVVHLTINGVKAGSTGAGAPLYRLVASDSAIHVAQDGSIDPSTISCDYTFTVGGVDSKGTDSDKSQLFYSINGGAETEYTAKTAIQTSGISSYIKFILKANDEVQDVETVKVLRDGEDGKDAPMTQNNLIVNSNFEGFSNGAMSGWKINATASTVIAEDKYNNQNVVLSRGDGLQTEVISSLDNMKKYVFSVYVKPSSANGFKVSFFAESNISVVTSDGSIESNGSSSATVTFGVAANVWTRVSVTISAADYGNFYIQFLASSGTFRISMPKLEEGEVVTPYIPAVADLTGPAGEAGVATFPLGDWMKDVRYTRTIASTISVHYLKDGKYYRLKKSFPEGTVGITPEDTDYWEYITDLGAIYAEFIMANFALFGSKRGGVFYDRYLFSQYGLNREGSVSYFSDHREGNNAMFDKMGTDADPTYVLNGNFQPHLFLDFLRGMIKTDKMSETFKEFEYISRTMSNEDMKFGETIQEAAEGSMLMTPCNVLDTDSGYNVSVEPSTNRWNDASITGENRVLGIKDSSLLLGMPLVDNIKDGDTILVSKAGWEPDGMKVCVLVRENDDWNKTLQYAERGMTSGYLLAKSITSGIVMCADTRTLDQHSYRLRTYQGVTSVIYGGDGHGTAIPFDAQYGGFFVVKGRITKFLLIEPGMMVRLRSCSIFGTELPLWYVENSDDFSEVAVEVDVYVNYAYDNGDMKKLANFTDITESDVWNEGYPFSWGYQTAGNEGTDFEFKNSVFATNGIAKVFEHMKDKGQDEIISIHTRSDKFYNNSTDNIYMIYGNRIQKD